MAKSPFTHVTLGSGVGLDINLNHVISLSVKQRQLRLVGYENPVTLEQQSAERLQHSINLFGCK